MKICMIGGTGLLGSQGAAELISRGHQVNAIALPPLPQGAVLPPEMEIEYGNYLEMNDDEIKKMFEGSRALFLRQALTKELRVRHRFMTFTKNTILTLLSVYSKLQKSAALSIVLYLVLIFLILQKQDRKCTLQNITRIFVPVSTKKRLP